MIYDPPRGAARVERLPVQRPALTWPQPAAETRHAVFWRRIAIHRAQRAAEVVTAVGARGLLFQQRRRGTLSSAAAKHSHHQQKHTKKQSEGGMGGIVIEHVYYYIHHQQIIHITTIPTKTKIKQRLGVKKRKTEIVIDHVHYYIPMPLPFRTQLSSCQQ